MARISLRFRTSMSAMVLSSAACLFFASRPAVVQMGMAGMRMKAVPAPEELPAPVRMTGIGNSHLSITASPEAQAWFDSTRALKEYAKFATAWKNADAELPEMIHARQFLAEHNSSTAEQTASATAVSELLCPETATPKWIFP